MTCGRACWRNQSQARERDKKQKKEERKNLKSQFLRRRLFLNAERNLYEAFTGRPEVPLTLLASNPCTPLERELIERKMPRAWIRHLLHWESVSFAE